MKKTIEDLYCHKLILKLASKSRTGTRVDLRIKELLL